MLAENLNEFEIIIGCFGGDAVEKFTSKKFKVIYFANSAFVPVKLISNFVSIYKFCKRNQVNIIHSHHRYFDIISWLISLFLDIKTITTVHSKVSSFRSLSYKSDHFIAVSESVKKNLIDNFKIDSNRISVIKNFVSEKNLINEVDGNLNYNLCKQKKKLLFVGRFSKEKGIDVLLKAFGKISSQNQNLYLILVGEGKEEKIIQSYIEEFNQNIFCEKPTHKINEFYKLADIVVLPSRIDPFPLVMLEAGLMKKPFIGSNVDGISEVIENNINGLLVRPENVNDLVKAILFLIKNESNAKILGENLYQKVTSEFTSDIIVPQYVNLYNQIFYEKN